MCKRRLRSEARVLEAGPGSSVFLARLAVLHRSTINEEHERQSVFVRFLRHFDELVTPLVACDALVLVELDPVAPKPHPYCWAKTYSSGRCSCDSLRSAPICCAFPFVVRQC